MTEPILKLLYVNLGLAGTWSASSSVASLPPSNLGHPNRGRPWRSTTAANQWVKVQLAEGGAFGSGSQVGGPDQIGGAAEAILVGGAALIDTNLTPQATVTLQGNLVDEWSSPAFTQALTPWDASRRGVMPLYFSAVQALPWWRWVFDDPSNPYGFIQVGVAPIGPVLTWERAGAPGVASAPGIGVTTRLIDPSLLGRAPAGTPYRFVLPKLFAMDIPTNAQDLGWTYDALWPVLERVGLTGDMVASLYADEPSGASLASFGMPRTTNMYGAFDGELSMSEVGLYYRGMLTLVESR